MQGDKAKEAFRVLLRDKETIEKEIGAKLDWRELPTKRDSRIVLLTDGDIRKRENWPEYFEWLHSETELFFKAFSERVKRIKFQD